MAGKPAWVALLEDMDMPATGTRRAFLRSGISFGVPDLGSPDAPICVVDHLAEVGLGDAAEHLDQAAAEILTFTGFPKAHWRQIWSNNPQERLNKEIRIASSL